MHKTSLPHVPVYPSSAAAVGPAASTCQCIATCLSGIFPEDWAVKAPFDHLPEDEGVLCKVQQ